MGHAVTVIAIVLSLFARIEMIKSEQGQKKTEIRMNFGNVSEILSRMNLRWVLALSKGLFLLLPIISKRRDPTELAFSSNPKVNRG